MAVRPLLLLPARGVVRNVFFFFVLFLELESVLR